MSEKVRIRCGTKNCGVAFEVEKEAIQYDRYIQCPMCSWQGKNPFYEPKIKRELPETHISPDKFKSKLIKGRKSLKTPLHNQAVSLIMKLKERGFSYGKIEYLSAGRLNKSQVWQIEKGKWWSKKPERQNEIIELLKKLTGYPNNSNSELNREDGKNEK